MRISNLVRPKTSKPWVSKDLTKRGCFDHSVGSWSAAVAQLAEGRELGLVSGRHDIH
jgi:hypothetical protein